VINTRKHSLRRLGAVTIALRHVNNGSQCSPPALHRDTPPRTTNFAINWRFTPTARSTNEFVIGQNGYDPIFGSPSSLEKISWINTRG